MMQSRRWAAGLAAFLLAASLVALPREGAAWTPYIDLTNPPVVDEGDPDEPGIVYMPMTFNFLGRPLNMSLRMALGRLRAASRDVSSSEPRTSSFAAGNHRPLRTGRQ